MRDKKLVTVLVYALLIGITVIMIYPFVWMLFGSFKSNTEIIQNPLALLPKKWSLDLSLIHI